VINAENSNKIVLPSLSTSKSTLIVGTLPDAIFHAAHKKGSLYGAYYNAWGADGISALFNGVLIPEAQIAPSATDVIAHTESYPTIVSNGIAASPLPPDNVIDAPKVIVFYQEGATKSSISEEDATKRCVRVYIFACGCGLLCIHTYPMCMLQYIISDFSILF
jgi:hypothetical protein